MLRSTLKVNVGDFRVLGLTVRVGVGLTWIQDFPETWASGLSDAILY